MVTSFLVGSNFDNISVPRPLADTNMSQLKFKLDRYNWLGQKLLALHQYEDIIHLRQHIINRPIAPNVSPILKSEQLSYIYALALMKTSGKLTDVVDLLQTLNYDKNSQYFLSLCQCLLYLGSSDSVVALCKQVINKEIDSFNSTASTNTDQTTELEDTQLREEGEEEQEEDSPTEDKRFKLYSQFMSNESAEFKKILANINKNFLINEPKLWFTFGLALEYQNQHREANLAFKVASKLSAGSGSGSETPNADQARGQDVRLAITSNYYLPHMSYAESCIRHQDDFKTATQALVMASMVCPQNYTITPMLALLISVHHNQSFNSSAQNSIRAMKIISKFESHIASNKNPALNYNNLALRCKENFQRQHSERWTGDLGTSTLEIRGEDLNYQLVKMHITLNNLLQEFNDKISIATAQADRNQMELSNQVDKLIESLKNTEPSCWISASLWNNLGICYLIKRRHIASLSCLLKAQSIDPLDWRINYNLAIASCHVGLMAKAYTCLLSARSFHPSLSSARKGGKERAMTPDCSQLLNSLLALSYISLGDVDESRRLFIEAIRPQKKLSLAGAPIASLVNYLIFLHKNPENSEQYVRLKLHLLDLLEQAWLQRHQNDPQFNPNLLDIANKIGRETFHSTGGANVTKKSFAWTKVDTTMSSKS